jgi:hypothetical protein
MVGNRVRRLALTRLVTLLTTVGLVALAAGSALVVTGLVGISDAATTTLSLTTTAAGASCNNSNPSQPVCTGLVGGDVVQASGTGFKPGALASVEECNSDPAQPVVFYLGNDIPVSCTALAITTIPSSGKNKGKLSAPKTIVQGTTGPPVTGVTPTCTQTEPSTSVITGCTTSGDASTDAANYPCPPTTAQQMAGDTCVLAIGDQAGDRAIGIILFQGEPFPTSSTTGTSSTSSTASTTTTLPTATVTTTEASVSTVTLGTSGSVTDNATVTGTPTNGSPAGNVAFYVCQTGTTQTVSPGPCAATASNHLSTVALTAGANNTATASSAALIPTVTGTWCFSAVYNPSSVYTTSADNTLSTNLDANECVLVTPTPATVSSVISAAQVTLGASGQVTDAVTVGGNIAGGTPTGTVSFYACNTGTTTTVNPNACPPIGTPVDTEPLIGGMGDSASATSNPFTPGYIGTWCFSVVYNGSATYATSGDNTSTANVDPGECVLVAPGTGDAITSAPFATAIDRSTFSFTVTTSGSPTPLLQKKGKLPRGIKFFKSRTGTTTMTGVANLKPKKLGAYHFTIIAQFGKRKSAIFVTQAFTLTVVS